MNVILGLCLLAFSVKQVASLKCYECLTGCDDPFNEKDAKKKDCSGSCSKSELNGHDVRGCALGVEKDDCEEVNGASACFCTEDLCNGATGRYMSRVSVLVTIASVCLSVFKFVF